VEDADKVLVSISVPPPTKRRAERSAKYHGRPITHFIERLPALDEKAVLEYLPNDKCRELYLQDRLKFKQAFPERRLLKRHERKYPDPAEGEHVAINALITEQAKDQFDRYCKFFKASKGLIVARFFKRLEGKILERLSDEDKQLFLAGKLKRPDPPAVKLDIHADEVAS
jgi:hypothetical protein